MTAEFGNGANLSEAEKRDQLNKALSGVGRTNSALAGHEATGQTEGGQSRADSWDILQRFSVLSDELRSQYEARLDAFEQALDVAEVELLTAREELLQQAYVLPDGTRIFFSADGATAVDEQGNPVDPKRFEDVPEEVRLRHRNKEEYLGVLEQLEAIERAREKITTARQRLEDPDFTPAELALLDRDLVDTIEPAVNATPSAFQKFKQCLATTPDATDAPTLTDDELALIDNGLDTPIDPAASFKLAAADQNSVESPVTEPAPPKDLPNITL